MENTKASIFSGVSHQFGHGFPKLGTLCSTSFHPFLTCVFFLFFSFTENTENSTRPKHISFSIELNMCREAEENTTEKRKYFACTIFKYDEMDFAISCRTVVRRTKQDQEVGNKMEKIWLNQGTGTGMCIWVRMNDRTTMREIMVRQLFIYQ